ncbi:unannotated protein [freshwater metagenome]|uniref:Unannotated protein n=1 Tax=freshwater metagenome TaxID=449393 RepID=A0A6J7M3E0_9ZZZZ
MTPTASANTVSRCTGCCAAQINAALSERAELSESKTKPCPVKFNAYSDPASKTSDISIGAEAGSPSRLSVARELGGASRYWRVTASSLAFCKRALCFGSRVIRDPAVLLDNADRSRSDHSAEAVSAVSGPAASVSTASVSTASVSGAVDSSADASPSPSTLLRRP